MTRKLYIVFALVFTVFFSCENDLDLNIDNTDGILTLNGYLYTGQDTNMVFLSLTSTDKPAPVSTAKMEMRINGELVETLNSAYVRPGTEVTRYYDDGSSTWTLPDQIMDGVYIFSKKFNAGDKIRIDAYYNGQHAWAEDIAPKPVKEISADFKTATHTFKEEVYSNEYKTGVYNDVDISFSDVSSSTEYYRLNTQVLKTAMYKTWKSIDERTFSDKENWDSYYTQYYVTGRYFDTFEEAAAFVRSNFHDIIETDDNIYYLEERLDRYILWDKPSYSDVNYRYDNDVIISEDETQKTDSDLDILIASVKNKYRVFSDNQFNNSNTVLHISVPYDMDAINEKSEIWVDWAIRNAPEELLKKAGDYYTYKIRLELQSISAQQYFYLRALNAINSDFYEDNSDLTGAMKIPSNVSGGCGNLSITTRSFYEISVLDNYHPKNIVINQEGNRWN
ncbi:MAG: DUF4249 domain-containing protein [Bacteroidales bacterium]|nr:DUF4249 domain-containing protein [Bacteroidales bacterium]